MSDVTPPLKRRLAAILAADIAGYSRLMGEDEAATVRNLKDHQAVVLPLVARHGGRIIDTAGDGILAEFPSVVGATECAIEIQAVMIARNADVPTPRRMLFRIGINLGDVIHDESRIYGDGINIAARLESIAEPGGICLSASAHEQVRGKIELEFADLGEQSLRNIIHPVRAYRVLSDKPVSRETKPPPLPDKPSIAVLSFQNLSGDPEQEYFVDGMVEEIVTALSRFRWLFVVARNSSSTYKGQTVDVKRVGRELGVRYVLEGAVRKAGNRVRITAQLIDAASGTHLWAEHFDGPLDDIFDLQDKVAFSVAGVIAPALRAAEAERASRRPTSDLTAYDLHLRAGRPLSSRTKEGVFQALALYEQAVAIDPQYGPAIVGLALCHLRLVADGWSEAPKTDRRKAIEKAQQALQVAENDPEVLARAAFVLGQLGEDIFAMMALVDRALALNPGYAYGWFISGALRLWAGALDLSIEHMETSLRLNPRERVGNHFLFIGAAHFFKRRFEEAAAKFVLDIQERPYRPRPYQYLAACYAHMGRIDEAREVVARLRAITPFVVPDELPLRTPEHRELLLSGLRLAIGEMP